MTDERWRRVSAIFHEALTRGPSARGAFLDEACAGDPLLRTELDNLLAADRAAGQWGGDPLLAAAGSAVAAGTTIGGHRVEMRIGAGGMGEVYRARDPQLNRPVAIKVLPPASVLDVAARQRLLREARAAASLNHPNICTIHEVGGADDGEAFIVMELVEGRGLDTLIPASGLALPEALRYARQLADALAHAHERGVVHRDLKPANIRINADGILKVLDFGLAKQSAQQPGVESTDLTLPSVQNIVSSA